jgi:phosphatidylinositol-3-phosphatase
VIWEENETLAVLNQMPYLASLASSYGSATNYVGVVHPSLGNYLVAASGQGASTCGLVNPDPADCSLSGTSVFGQALSAGKTAKSYAESMTTPCQRTSANPYAVRHNPWPYFADEAASCEQLDVPLGTTSSGELLTDTQLGTLPNVGMVIPNLQDDMHDGTPQQADAWLSDWMPLLMAGPDYQAGHLAIIVTFDEGIGSNQTVPFVVVSPGQSGRVVSDPYDHYSLCRMYSDVLGAAPLTGCANSPGLAAGFGLIG